MNSSTNFVPILIEDLLKKENGKFRIGGNLLKFSNEELKQINQDLEKKFPYTSPSINTLHRIIESFVCHVCGQYNVSHKTSIKEYPSTCPLFNTIFSKRLVIEDYVNFLEKTSNKYNIEANKIHQTIIDRKGYIGSLFNKTTKWSTENYISWLNNQLCRICHQYHLYNHEWCRECFKCWSWHHPSSTCRQKKRCLVCGKFNHEVKTCCNLGLLRKVASKVIRKI